MRASAQFSLKTLSIQLRSITAILNVVSLKCLSNTFFTINTPIFSARIMLFEKPREEKALFFIKFALLLFPREIS